jgi:flagellar hook-length control protein FliK
MLPGTEMTAVHPLERQRPETASKINGPASSAAFTDRAEERQPLFRQVSRGLVWSLHRGEEKIQITLDPPHLGTIFLELHRNRQTVEAQVWTDNPATKGLLETQQGQLHKALEQEGFRLDRFEVAVQPDLKSFSEERWAQGRHPVWEGLREQGREGADERARPGALEKNVSRFQNGNRYIDTWI